MPSGCRLLTHIRTVAAGAGGGSIGMGHGLGALVGGRRGLTVDLAAKIWCRPAIQKGGGNWS